MNTSLFQTIEQIVLLTEDERQLFSEILRQKSLSKGELWQQADKQNRDIAFLEKGYLRKFYLNEGDEITESFYFDGEFCADLPSLIGSLNPTANFIAMESTYLTVFSYDKLMWLVNNSITFERLYRILVEQAFLRFYKRTVSFINLSPKQRYEQLTQESPIVLQRAAQYHIASYLGISYQHLSRLRAMK